MLTRGVCVRMRMHMQVFTHHRAQRRILRGEFFPVVLLVPGMKLRLPGLHTSVLPAQPSHGAVSSSQLNTNKEYSGVICF